ncbi:Hypothetical predicted protein [Pelobates cultripes]|uniref:SoHo domain-containing protein n=1 Tax=Pelobates cultripes TaxID=61616 RepID=A0AAD1RNJ9_PELCU|nr:Hypothetical predicted protein [Pelobates cultripes]
MEQQDQDIKLLLTLDDFIPPHLQKKPSPKQEQIPSEDLSWPESHPYSSESMHYYNRTTNSPPTEDKWETSSQQKFWIRYDGIGPTDEEGMPYASRTSVDKPRDWYKSMFKVLHRRTDSEDSDSEDEELGNPGLQTKSPNSLSNADRLQNNQKLEHYKLKDPPVTISPTFKQPQKKINSNPAEHETTLKPTLAKSKSTLNHIPKKEDSSKTNISSKLHYYSNTSSPLNQSTGVQLNTNLTSKGPKSTSQLFHNVSQKSSSPTTKERSPAEKNGLTEPRHKVEKARLVWTSLEHNSQDPYLGSSNDKPELATKKSGTLQNLSTRNRRLSSGSTSKETSSLSLSPKEARHYRRSTSKVLDQLEAELQEFTKELERDQKVHMDTPGNLLNQNTEVTIQRFSSMPVSPGGSNTQRDHSNILHTKNSTDLKEIAKAVVKFNFVAQSSK